MDRNGYLVVSGVPRGGSSLGMNIQKVAHGEEFLLGEEFPQDPTARRAKMRERQEGEPAKQYEARKYSMELRNKRMPQEEREEQAKRWARARDMNPKGYWEMAFTVRGIQYSLPFADELKSVRDGAFRIVKVVCSGLPQSDPIYIDRIIFPLRNPRSVAESQIRLFRANPLLDDLDINCPLFYIQSMLNAATFFTKFPDIPVMFYDYDDLLSNPQPILEEMQEFVGRGDYMKAMDIIDPKLHRSKGTDDQEGDLFEEADDVYCLASEGKWQECLDLCLDATSATTRRQVQWFCPRAAMQVTAEICKNCREVPDTRMNFKKYRSTRDLTGLKAWEEEPCLFECGFDQWADKHLTIKQSIKNNFWKHDKKV